MEYLSQETYCVQVPVCACLCVFKQFGRLDIEILLQDVANGV